MNLDFLDFCIEYFLREGLKNRNNISLYTKEFLGFEELQERDKEKVSLYGENFYTLITTSFSQVC